MFGQYFWRSTGERAVKTFAQALAAVLVTSGATLLSAGWKVALATAGMAALVSVLTSVASLRVGPPDSPSMVRTGPPAPPASPAVVPAPAPEPEPVSAAA